jgi:hypothetical protein
MPARKATPPETSSSSAALRGRNSLLHEGVMGLFPVAWFGGLFRLPT